MLLRLQNLGFVRKIERTKGLQLSIAGMSGEREAAAPQGLNFELTLYFPLLILNGRTPLGTYRHILEGFGAEIRAD